MTLLLAILLFTAGPVPAAEPASADREVLHVLDRLAFGPSRDDVEHVKSIGIDNYIAEQLSPQAIAEPAALTDRLAGLNTLAMTPVQLWQRYGSLQPVNGVPATQEAQQERRRESQIIVQQAREARILRAVYSRRQLQEVMVEFWYNHFNVFGGKSLDRLWVGAFEEQAIRPHALGKFRDLLQATARHPAMLFYLDNSQNVAAGTRRSNGSDAGLNENYAREIMELHTLGVDGGYTQDDVVALARILTGWGLGLRNPVPGGGGFRFIPANHDAGPKQFLGHEIGAWGEAEGTTALELLARSPATAHHIALELALYFVADEPPPALVERAAAQFLATDGDIRATLQTLLTSREFRDSIGAKYKTPYRYVVSAVRAADVPVRNPRPLLYWLARMGQPLYGCQTPDGYRDTADQWLSPDATTLRISFASNLGRGVMPLAVDPPTEGVVPASAPAAANKPPPPAPDAIEALLAAELTANTRAVVASVPPARRAALLLGSPDFMRR